MKDFIKIINNRDKKAMKAEIDRIKSLQKQGFYPELFKMPLTLQFELTSCCNVKCKHCYNNSGMDNQKKDAMTPKKWLEFANYLVDKGGIFQCVISGGEPLILGEDLYDIMDVLHNDGTSFLVISNGLLMTKEKAKRFAKYRYKWFQISIDGYNAEYHDEFRQRQGSWEKATSAVFWLASYGIPVTIAHSVSPQNLKDIDKMCELAFALGAGSIILGEITPSGRSANDLSLILTREEKQLFLEKFEENAVRYQDKMLVRRSADTKMTLLRYKNLPNSGAIIRPNGDIRLDCMAPFTIGNIIESDFCNIWENKAHDSWQHPEVTKYIEGYQGEANINSYKKNYFDMDIRL